MRPSGSLNSVVAIRPVAAVIAAEFMRTFTRSAAWIFMPLYLERVRHIPYGFIGLIFTVASMAAFPFALLGGNLIDRLGSRKILLTVSPLLSIVFFSMSFLVYSEARSIYLYAAFISSFPLATVQATADSVVVTHATELDQRITAFSLTRISANVGFSAGPVLGGALSALGYHIIFAMPAIAAICETLLYWAIVRQDTRAGGVEGAVFHFPWDDRVFILVVLLVSLSWFGAGQWGTTLTLFLSSQYGISNLMIGAIYASNGVAVAVLQLPMNRLLRRIDEVLRIGLGSVIYGVAFFLYSVSGNIFFLIGNTVFLTLGENTISPVMNSLVSRMAPPERRGAYFGTLQFFNGFISPLAPLMGSEMLQSIGGHHHTFWGIIMAINLSVAAAILSVRRLRGVRERLSL
ncbi:MFS transporter [Thermogymnomonas acidicola]|uniref:MFS transporter n=1 Tax=Thermogymnomonas acidicola TaxID=399579 RepID=A0AA37BQR5_9ARCH|nr:MFS transporter [Thermogymnomonas acidicola]